jgi:hypothetical protein
MGDYGYSNFESFNMMKEIEKMHAAPVKALAPPLIEYEQR